MLFLNNSILAFLLNPLLLVLLWNLPETSHVFPGLLCVGLGGLGAACTHPTDTEPARVFPECHGRSLGEKVRGTLLSLWTRRSS